MAGDDNPGEVAVVKQWLRDLRAESGLTQRELAAAMGVKERTVLNAESDSVPALPRGLPFLKMLRELGVLAESPIASLSVTDRLAALEAQVDEGAKDVVLSLQDLAEEVRALARRAEPGGGSATGGLAE